MPSGRDSAILPDMDWSTHPRQRARPAQSARRACAVSSTEQRDAGAASFCGVPRHRDTGVRPYPPVHRLLLILVLAWATTGRGDDLWYRIEFDDQPVGFESLSTSRLQPTDASLPADAPGATMRRFRRTELKLKRFGRDLSVSSELSTQESADGRLFAWSLRRTAGDGTTVERSGTWNEERRGFEVSELQQATRRTLRLPVRSQPWSPVVAGWASAALREPRQRWTRAVLFPETNAVAQVRFVQRPPQSLRDEDGRLRTVTPLRFEPTSDPELTTTLYLDDRGQVLRSEQSLLGATLVLRLTTPAAALAGAGVQSLDIDAQSLIPVNRQIGHPHTRSETRLRIITEGSAPRIPVSEWQSVESQPDGSLIVTLRRPERPANGRADQEVPSVTDVDAVYLQTSPLLNWQSDPVRRFSLRAGGSSTAEWDQCTAIAGYLSANLRRSPFSTSLQPADQIAESLRGDCTEHAVLMAAMLRARGIPSRVVTGLVYVERVSAFAAHMWVEALVEGQWFPFDSASGGRPPGADHIKLLDSPLDSQSTESIELFLPLLPVIGQTRIELLPEAF